MRNLLRNLQKYSQIRHNTSMKKLLVAVAATALMFGLMPSAHAWNVETEVDDFGSTRVIAKTYFMSGVGNTDSFDEAYENGDYQSLMMRCQDATLEIYVTTLNGEFGKSSSALVRFGNAAPKKWSVTISSSKTAVFLLNERLLATTIAKSKKFAIRASGSQGYIAANFNTAGLSSYRSEFKNAGCKF